MQTGKNKINNGYVNKLIGNTGKFREEILKISIFYIPYYS